MAKGEKAGTVAGVGMAGEVGTAEEAGTAEVGTRVAGRKGEAGMAA